MTGDELREVFLHFFKEKGHEVVPSSSLVPQGDPTLLLTTAGMVQFKRYFTGLATPPNMRLASCQKCFRATDIDAVGDSKHLTFFEMLGNFSVGDYFKKEAIAWAWEFITQYLKLAPRRLWITIFLDDDEAFGHWREVGVPAKRILRFGEEDNFWGPAGDTGPCGPCSEIHYDLGQGVGCGRPDCGPGCECGRFVEIWNLVFTQYDQQEDGRRVPLPKPNIDTGMGLERTAAAIQGKTSVYESDLFAPIIDCVSRLAGRKYGEDEAFERAIRIVAEHGRAITFLISDGVVPSNEGRGYVLRRVLRRAALFGRKLGLEEPFLGDVARAAISEMGHQYPELVSNRDFILSTIEAEEMRFVQTLETGVGRLNDEVVKAAEQIRKVTATPAFLRMLQELQRLMPPPDLIRLSQETQKLMAPLDSIQKFRQIQRLMPPPEFLRAIREVRNALVHGQELTRNVAFGKTAEKIRAAQTISGEEAFKLYDTYGFPPELTAEVAAENGLTADLKGFDTEMERQRERARAAQKVTVGGGQVDIAGQLSVVHIPRSTEFVGDRTLKHRCTVAVLLREGGWTQDSQIESTAKGQQIGVILYETPFYGEMGGQVGDIGEIRGEKGRMIVTNTVRHTVKGSELIVHQGRVVEGTISKGEIVEAIVDEKRRLDIARNHTATHLLQAALRQVLGSQVQQSGSLVAPERLRFDFTHLSPITKEHLAEVQRLVNEMVRQNLLVRSKRTSYGEAMAQGALAFFGEKYGEEVTVLEIGEPAISAELCGGTHVKATGEIGLFLILSESSIGAGMRRIEAITGRGAEDLVESQFSIIEDAARELRVPTPELKSRISALQAELDGERRRALSLERELLRNMVDSLINRVESINDVNVLAAKVPASNMESLRYAGDLIKERMGSAVVVLGAVFNNRPNFVTMVTPDLVARGLDAGDIVKQVAAVTGGSGGGKAQLGQAGGKDKGRIDDALKLVRRLVGRV